MNSLDLKYGCNPNQKPARVYMADGSSLPFEVINGSVGYINLLDAMNAYQLVRELSLALGYPSAASFKHVSPAGAAIGSPLTEKDKQRLFAADIEGLDSSPLAVAYAKARGADRMSSFGDFIALSDVCDEVTARVIKREVSDGIIAPGYSPEALELLKTKKRGSYCILQMDKGYLPQSTETRQVFGVTFMQQRNNVVLDASALSNVVTSRKEIPQSAKNDLLLALITLKYTQSNSVCYAFDGQTIGVGAGQQSRIHCTRLAGSKADSWMLRGHTKTLCLPFLPSVARPDRDNAVDCYVSGDRRLLEDGVWQGLFTHRPEPLTQSERLEYISRVRGVSLGSDAFFPFSDNIERAAASGVEYIAQAGGSKRDAEVIEMCDKLNIAMCINGIRLFHH